MYYTHRTPLPCKADAHCCWEESCCTMFASLNRCDDPYRAQRAATLAADTQPVLNVVFCLTATGTPFGRNKAYQAGHLAEQAGNPDESGTSSRPIGNAPHDTGTALQVCFFTGDEDGE